jgi:hypothetical protein
VGRRFYFEGACFALASPLAAKVHRASPWRRLSSCPRCSYPSRRRIRSRRFHRTLPGNKRSRDRLPALLCLHEAAWAVSRFSGISDLAVPLAVLGIVLAMIMPMPSFLLDILISANITLSVIVLLVSMYITRPVEFSVFPTSLVLMTLFRLALNISSSRLILIHGNTGTRAAGQVIEAFGNFVVGGNYIIGVVISWC